MEIEDSYDALFEELDFENTDWILPLVRKCISTSPGEKEVLRGLEILLCFCLKKFSPEDLEKEVFRMACPATKEMIVGKLNQLEKNPTSCVESLNVSVKVLSYLGRVFEYLNEIPQIAINKVDSLLINTSEILHSCFSHCKVSEEVYGSLFNSLAECLSNFFKNCCSLQEQLLQFLTEKADCDPDDDRDYMLLDKTMTCLSKVGIILVNLEAKTMAKVWKAFVFLIERHLCCLKSHNIGETIKNLSSSITANLEMVNKNNQDFGKTAKLCNFLLKLIIKFSQVFSGCLENCQNSLLNLLLTLCKFNVMPDLNQDVSCGLFFGIDPLLSLLMADVGFIRECFTAGEDVKKAVEFCVLCCTIGRKLMDGDLETWSLWFNKEENILELMFFSVSCSQCMTANISLPNILVSGKQKKFTDLYEYTLVTASALAGGVTTEEFSFVEETLIKNVLQANPIRAVIAIDIWCLLARIADSKLCFSQILALGKMFQQFHPTSFRVEKCYLASLIRRLFPLLANSHREAFLNSFPSSFYSAVWDGVAGCGLAPNEARRIRQAVLAEVDPLLDHPGGVSTGANSAVSKLWKFNCDALPSTPEGVKFLRIICSLTASAVADMSSEDLYLVLTQVKNLLAIGQPTYVKLFFLWILNSLSTVRVPPGPQQKQITTTVAQLFKDLLSSRETLAREKAREVFYTFSHITPHGEVIPMSVQNAPGLKLEIMDYFKRKPPEEAGFNLSEYFGEVYRSIGHVCRRTVETGGPSKKAKLDMEGTVTRWKAEGKIIAEHFHSLSEAEKREVRNVCNSILSFP